MKFKSQFFDTADDLLFAKDDCWEVVRERRDRLKTVRAFTNMMATMTEEEAEDLGREEITNHGLTYTAMLANETMFRSMTSVTNSLVEIIVDTDNLERDTTTGIRMSEAINRGAINHRGKFNSFWGRVSGEIVMTGGAPVCMPEKYGWLPELRCDMIFPPETELDADEIPYAFDPTNLTFSDLKRLQKTAENKSAGHIDLEAINDLIGTLREQYKNRGARVLENYQERSRPVRDEKHIGKHVTVPAWWYYEIKTKAGTSGDKYVSATLFVDTTTVLTKKSDKNESSSSAVVIAHIEDAYKSADEWLHYAFVDSEIGGVKTIDSLRGVAELSYPSGSEMEELLNLMLEGDKLRARPRFQVGTGANPDDIKKFDALRDLWVPQGVDMMRSDGGSGSLQTPLFLLTQNAASIASAPVSNSPRGGELRTQSLERQQNNVILQTNRLVEAFNHLDVILENVVERLLLGEVEPGCEGYHETMWVRAYLDRYNIPYRDLAKKEHGRFKYIRVRARRSIGNGDRQQQIETSDWLMTNIQHYAPSVRPLVIHQATILRTQDPDAADTLVNVPKPIINAQKITAENEYDTIRRRAALGQILPVAADDVHQDHIPVHLLDMQAHLASNEIRPWDRLDVISFAGLTEHVGEHIKILLSNPVTNPEAKVFLQDFQNLAQSAQRVVQSVEEQSGSEENDLTASEKAQMQLKMAQLELEGRKLGIKVEDTQRLWKSRESREMLARRTQLVREVNEARRLDLDEKRLEQEKLNNKQKNAKSSK